jgi:hypothetical protein
MESNILYEFLADLFFWMEENEIEDISAEGIQNYLHMYLANLEWELEGMKQMKHEAVLNQILGASGIDPARD